MARAKKIEEIKKWRDEITAQRKAKVDEERKSNLEHGLKLIEEDNDLAEKAKLKVTMTK